MNTLILILQTIGIGLAIFGTPAVIALIIIASVESMIDRRAIRAHERARAMRHHPAGKGL